MLKIFKFGNLSSQSVEPLGDCSKLEWLHLTTGLEENAAQSLIDALHSQLKKLQVKSVPHNCIEFIAAGFPKMKNIRFEDVSSPDVQAKIGGLSAADVDEWASDFFLGRALKVL